MTDVVLRPHDTKSALDALGSLRAEWLADEQLFDWFSEPGYFPSLESSRSCVLKGGRGTGKTTVLRCLSYSGQEALKNSSQKTDISHWSYFGFYYRVNTNRVTAFQGPEFSEERWGRFFAHYVNLLLCSQLSKFIDWFECQFDESIPISTETYEDIGISLGFASCYSNDELQKALRRGRLKFETYLNNLDPENLPQLSLQGAPIDEFSAAIGNADVMKGRSLFFIIDEFENLLPIQQRVMNTLIKQAQGYSFKIGVRELGWRERRTLNATEQLVSPADYELVDISDQIDTANFTNFAAKICSARLRSIEGLGTPKFDLIGELFTDLSMDQEAQKLGVEKIIQKRLASLRLNHSTLAHVSSMAALKVYLVFAWTDAYGESAEKAFNDLCKNPKSWDDRYGNYKYTLLFALSSGKSLKFSKYYSGWSTLVLISGANIRYLLQLIYECIRLNLLATDGPIYPLSPEIQTTAAIGVGRQGLRELEGLSVNGAKLTRMVLSLGRVFNVFSDKLRNVAPETNHFTLPEKEFLKEETRELLDAAVMHMALVRNSGTKQTDESSTKDYDYSLHPIFAPHFSYSHRRKRKMTLTQNQLMGLVDTPKATISSVLAMKELSDDGELPEQLMLFRDFYAGPSLSS